MIVASVTFDADGSYRCEVQASEGLYPDGLDDVVARCVRLVRDVQAGLPGDEPRSEEAPGA